MKLARTLPSLLVRGCVTAPAAAPSLLAARAETVVEQNSTLFTVLIIDEIGRLPDAQHGGPCDTALVKERRSVDERSPE